MSNIAQTSLPNQSSLIDEVEGRFRMNPQPSDWRYVAKQLRDEENSEKMLELAVELNSLLEREEKLRKQPIH